MIGISCIIEENCLFKNINESDAKELFSAEAKDVHFDKFDFENNTFIDFVDYLDFQEYQKYIFFVGGSLERIYKLVQFLESELEETDFCIVDDNLEVKHGDFELIDMLHPLKGIFQLEKEKAKLSHMQYLRNGLMSLFSGVYPPIINKRALKHLYVENCNVIKNIEPNVYYNMAVNSSIFIDQSSEEVELNSNDMKEVPNIILLNNSVPSFQKEDLTSLEADELDELISKFKNSGVIENKESKKAIFDYATLTKTSTNNRLFVYSDGIFNDYLKENVISKNIKLHYFDIVSKYQNNEEQDKVEAMVKNIIPLMFNLAASFKGGATTFTTPYTKNKLDLVVDSIVEFKLIGIQNNRGCFVYNIQTNKVFETDETFLEILEADQKNSQSYLKDRFKDQYDAIMNEYKGLVEHA
ncbi:hypothetical protein [Bacillus cereus]|uniref:hypothetical protein n=1 Tax=Bacillus cereus TaxID=1396 RepID=UPI000BF738D0|nr:hypothetical protein [Bacillus cereus]PFI23081.1 hypothetical protein COI75_14385 [Bacillus cereus]